MTVRPTWDLDIGGSAHRVELAPFDPFAGPPRRFRFDRVEGELYRSSPWTWVRWLVFDKPTVGVAKFTMGGQPASLTLVRRTPRYSLRLRAAFGGSLRALPQTLLARVSLGHGAAGAASAGAAWEAMVSWLFYGLTVGGVPRGTWVASLLGSDLVDWWFVEPGQRLPTRDDAAWPLPEEAAQLRTARADERAGDPWPDSPPRGHPAATSAMTDVELGAAIARLAGGRGPSDLVVEPARRRMMSVRLERRKGGVGALDAFIPAGSGRTRAVLVELGWARPTSGTGGRYYRRRFERGADVVASLRTAYSAVYQDRARDLRWTAEPSAWEGVPYELVAGITAAAFFAGAITLAVASLRSSAVPTGVLIVGFVTALIALGVVFLAMLRADEWLEGRELPAVTSGVAELPWIGGLGAAAITAFMTIELLAP